MPRNGEHGDLDLLSAYVDGVSELSLDERKRVDDLLARDPALRETETETRALLGELRELPPRGNEPDWSALERSIKDAVGTEVPRPWWAKLRWRFVVPVVALAMSAAILALVLHDPKPEAPPTPIVQHDPAPVVEDTAITDDISSSIPLWLDGTDLEVALEAAEMFDLDWDVDEESVPETAELLPPTDLEWVDDLDPESLDRAERFLDHKQRRGRT